MGRSLSTPDPNANIIGLPSATGFSAGDYIYRMRSGYGSIPDNAVTSGLFNFTDFPSDTQTSDATGIGDLTYVEYAGGSSGSQNAARLVGGNIVYVYAGAGVGGGNVATAYFKIVDSAGATVVAATSTGITNVDSPYNVSVVALPNGNFAVVASALNTGNNSFYPAYRIFNPDGSTASAIFTSTTASTANTGQAWIKLGALSDSSFIMAVDNSGNVNIQKGLSTGFDATFGSLGVRTVSYTNATGYQNWDFTVDSSNNFYLIYNNGTTNAQTVKYNASGATIWTGSLAILNSLTAMSVVVLPSGAIRVLAQGARSNATDYGVFLYQLDPSTGSITYIGKIISGTATVTPCSLFAYPEGVGDNFSLLYSQNSATSNPLLHNVFSAAGVAQLISPNFISQISAAGPRMLLTPVQVGSSTRVYFCPNSIVGVNWGIASTFSNTSVPPGICYFEYNSSTYRMNGLRQTARTYSGMGPFALNGYARLASTASTAAFSIAATGLYAGQTTVGNTVIPKTIVNGTDTAYRASAVALPNGEFAIAYTSTSATNGYATYLYKYSKTGSLLGSVTVASGGTTTSASWLCCAASFANGNIAVAYQDPGSTSTLLYKIYSPSLVQMASGVLTTGLTASPDSYNHPSICSFGTGDYVAVAWPQSSNYGLATLSSTGSRPFSDTPLSNARGVNLIGYKSNSFTAVGANGTNLTAISYVQTGPSTFAGVAAGAGSQTSYSSSNTFPSGNSSACPANMPIFLTANTSATPSVELRIAPSCVGNPDVFAYTNLGTSDFNNNYSRSIGYAGDGTPVIATPYSSSAPTAQICFAVAKLPSFGNASFTSPISTIVRTGLTTQNNTNPVSIAPHVGSSAIFAYIDASGYPAFAAFDVAPVVLSQTLTAGVDTSTTTLSLSPQTGYLLQGVSLTNAPAGGTGLVQTRGTAQLNSSYSASTPMTAFDFRNPIIASVSGTVSGRNVILESQ